MQIAPMKSGLNTVTQSGPPVGVKTAARARKMQTTTVPTDVNLNFLTSNCPSTHLTNVLETSAYSPKQLPTAKAPLQSPDQMLPIHIEMTAVVTLALQVKGTSGAGGP